MKAVQPKHFIPAEDGLIAPEIGSWGEDKYRLVQNYAAIFASSMKKKWHSRVYIDLFSGPGRARIRGSGRLVVTSPIRAMEVPNPFDRYIFCDKSVDCLEALRARVCRDHSDINARYIVGDINANVSVVLDEIPHPSKTHSVLAFCFVDPFKLSDLAFATISQLATRFVDFLVLIPTDMDARRNFAHYVRSSNPILDRFLGDSAWRQEWREAEGRREKFGAFLTKSFGGRMKQLNYIFPGIQQTELICYKNLPLYRLAFFSRHPLGEGFWKATRETSSSQRELFQR